ncbi:MAG: elongation factor Ts [Chlamydiales bacterium]|nr:elongation factor Ts [Chlamydiales bacterium]
MTEVTAQMVKELRNRTGIGMGKCKEALQEAEGDIELAIANLRKAGMASAVKKEGRETNEGVICTAENESSIALVEVNAETDFVVKNERFQEFAANLADEVLDSKPSNIEEFLKQPYSKEPGLTIDQYRATIVQGLGENVQVRRLELFPKKSDSTIAVYSHQGGKLVTLVEIAGSDDESELAKDIAMHVAAEAPEYLSSEEVPDRVIAHEKEIAAAQIKGKPENILNKILEGKLKAYFDQVCLLNQKFVKNPDLTIQQLVEKQAKERGKKLTVSQFLRWRVGE